MSGTDWTKPTVEELEMLADLTDSNCHITRWEENFLHELERKKEWSENMRAKLRQIYEQRIENA